MADHDLCVRCSHRRRFHTAHNGCALTGCTCQGFEGYPAGSERPQLIKNLERFDAERAEKPLQAALEGAQQAGREVASLGPAEVKRDSLDVVIWSMTSYLKQREFKRTSGEEGASTMHRMTQPEADLILDWVTDLQKVQDERKQQAREVIREILDSSEEILVQDIRNGDHIEFTKFHAAKVPTRVNGIVVHVVHDEGEDWSYVKMHGIPEFFSLPKTMVASRFVR